MSVLHSYEDNLQVFKLKYKNNDDGAQVARFNPTWFKINSLSEKLQFTLRNLETMTEVKSDIHVMITFYLQSM
jgi:hypothetical protein